MPGRLQRHVSLHGPTAQARLCLKRIGLAGSGPPAVSEVTILSEQSADSDRESINKPRTVTVQVTIPPTYDMPVLFANQLLANYTGHEFYLTVLATVPEPWQFGQEPSRQVQARVLGRFGITPSHWVEFVESVTKQLAQLREQGFELPSKPAEAASDGS